MLHHRLQRLDNHAHQKLEHLRRFDADAADVVDWLRANRAKFRMEIFEPALLCVTVPNRHYVDAVEACFGGPQLRTFVAQCEEDYQLLNRLCVDTPEALGRKARINTWYKARDESRLQPPPLPVDQLQAMGFDGYALDFIDCPKGLKWFLCADVRLHRTVGVWFFNCRLCELISWMCAYRRSGSKTRERSTRPTRWRWRDGRAGRAMSSAA